MRVIAGDLGGRDLACPKGKAVRPITGRVKGAVFNILGHRVGGAKVLDLYAGCGSFGIEALSRGAAWVDFVEREAGHVRFLEGNLEALGLSPRAGVHVREVRAALAGLAGPVDLILADPPFSPDRKLLPPDVYEDLAALSASPVWAPGGILVLDHRGGRPLFPEAMGPWLGQQRDYGDATVSFFRKPG